MGDLLGGLGGPEADRLRRLGYLDEQKPIFHDPAWCVFQAHQQLKPLMNRGCAIR